MSEELKACICGTPAHIHEISMGDNWRTRYQIWCHDKACGFEGGIYNSTKKCVEEWNTRPIEDALRTKVERLQEAIEYVLFNLDPSNTTEDINTIRDEMKRIKHEVQEGSER